MAKDTSRRQTALLAVAVCVAVGVLAWLLVVDARDRGAARAGRAPADGQGSALRAAEGRASADARADGPVLGPTTTSPRPPVRGDVRVVVVNGHLHALEGLRVELVAAAEADLASATVLATMETDPQGLVTFTDQPLDGSRVARVIGATPAGKAARRAGNGAGVLVHAARVGVLPVAFVPLDEATEWLRLRNGLPLTLRTVGAAPGPARVRLTSGAPFYRDFRAEADGPYDVRADSDLATALAPGRRFDLRLRVQAEGHHVEPIHWHGRLLPTTEHVAALVPVRPEAQVHVLFPTDALRGQGTAPKIVVSTFAAWTVKDGEVSRDRFVSATLDARGRLVIRGVPHYVGRWVVFNGCVGEVCFQAEGRLPEDPASVLELAPQIDDQEERRRHVLEEHDMVRFLEELIPSTDDLMLAVVGKEHEHREGLFHAVAPGDGIVVDDPSLGPPFDVVVEHAHDSLDLPRAGATVRLGPIDKRTNEDGVARFRELPPGRHAGWVFGFGAAQRITVDVPAAGVGRHVVRPTWGGAIHLTVVDDEDRPLPFASFSLQQPSGAPWASPVWMGKGLLPAAQRVDPYVDQRGQRRLRCVEVGAVTLEVRYGLRSDRVTVEVAEGKTHEVRVVLPMQRTSVLDAASGEEAK